jgi:hypothetical protein
MAAEPLPEADFRTLGLEPGSKPSEVRRAYRELVKKWHPDRHHLEPYETRAHAEKKFREIDEAYRRISRRWKEAPRHAGPFKKAAGMGTGASYDAQNPDAKPHPGPAARSGPSIAFPSLSSRKFILPAILILVAMAFIFTRLVSLSPDKKFDDSSLHLPVAGDHKEVSLGGPPSRDEAADLSSDVSLQPPDAGGQTGILSDDRIRPDEAAGLRLNDSLQSQSTDIFNPQRAGSDSFFTIGSTRSEVLAVQGAPSRVHGQTWVYGLSEVQFRNGHVSRYDNFDGSLRVCMQPQGSDAGTQPDHITIGSSEQEVLAVQGTPTRVEGSKWFYGFSEIVFKNGRVAEYDNYFGILRIHLAHSPSLSDSDLSKGYFTIGSSPDEVLAVQGTPTAVHGSRWSFDLAGVLFRQGKVHSVTDTGGTLHFVAPEEK